MNEILADFHAQMNAVDAECAERRKTVALSTLDKINAARDKLRDERLSIHHQMLDLNALEASVREVISDRPLPIRSDRPGIVKRNDEPTVYGAVLSVMSVEEWMTSVEVVDAVLAQYPNKWKRSAIYNALFQGMVPTHVETKKNDRLGGAANSKLYRLQRAAA
jgi:hypothetical protein